MEELCEELDICMALDPDSKIAVYRSNTVAELVSALAHFMSSKGMTEKTPLRYFATNIEFVSVKPSRAA